MLEFPFVGFILGTEEILDDICSIWPCFPVFSTGLVFFLFIYFIQLLFRVLQSQAISFICPNFSIFILAKVDLTRGFFLPSTAGWLSWSQYSCMCWELISLGRFAVEKHSLSQLWGSRLDYSVADKKTDFFLKVSCFFVNLHAYNAFMRN